MRKERGCEVMRVTVSGHTLVGILRAIDPRCQRVVFLREHGAPALIECQWCCDNITPGRVIVCGPGG